MKGPRLEAQRSRGPTSFVACWWRRSSTTGDRWADAQVVPGRAESDSGRQPMIRSPLWSPLMTAHDPTVAIAGHDPHREGQAVTSREPVGGGQWITRLPASGL